MTAPSQPAGGTPGRGQQAACGHAESGSGSVLDQLREKVREANAQSEANRLGKSGG
ncbi:hypothetical protein ACTWP5_28620 [Streptomyces sp. 4N509B]|uniref:hypothetical protein n=1 Tax=Streptomyces sp. 4N509B TaxID=3457413 RepID=UPI003FCEFDF4